MLIKFCQSMVYHPTYVREMKSWSYLLSYDSYTLINISTFECGKTARGVASKPVPLSPPSAPRHSRLDTCQSRHAHSTYATLKRRETPNRRWLPIYPFLRIWIFNVTLKHFRSVALNLIQVWLISGHKGINQYHQECLKVRWPQKRAVGGEWAGAGSAAKQQKRCFSRTSCSRIIHHWGLIIQMHTPSESMKNAFVFSLHLEPCPTECQRGQKYVGRI